MGSWMEFDPGNVGTVKKSFPLNAPAFPEKKTKKGKKERKVCVVLYGFKCCVG